jgi:hypothetical protein
MKKNLISIFFVLALVIALAPLVPAYAEAAGPLDHVVISPTSANVSVGGTQQFDALGQDSNNVTIPALAYTWSVVAGGGTIDDTGLFMAGNVTGTFTNTVQVITARNSTIKTAFASVMVTAVPVSLDHLVISPTSTNVSVGGTSQFDAQGQDSNNVTIPDLAYTWSMVAGGGTIDDTGLFTAGNTTGTFTNTVQVIAEQDGVTRIGYASVVVTSAPAPQPALPPATLKGKKKGWEGDTPPGWSQGQKRGWQGNNMPPGLAKGKKAGQPEDDKNEED